MDKSSGIISVFFVLLFAGVLIAGCSSDSPSSNAIAQASVTTAPVSSGALYSAGDIIKNPASASATALLIINYDASTDMYERAYIFPNSDGTWGYRMDSKTDKISRSLIDKVYTKKVGTKSISAVPISTPTPAVTATSVYTTTTPVASVTGTTTTTTSTSGLPKIVGIPVPDEGKTGTSVSITELKGVNFQSGATVSLVKSGNPNITATNVNVQSSNLITCMFAIPSNATVGNWDLVVKNPDGQYHQYQGVFTVRQGSTSSSTTTTTTTSTTSTSAPTISGDLAPATSVSGEYYQPQISGTNFRDGITAKLTHDYKSEIPANVCSRSSTIQMQCFFSIPTGSTGTWNLVLTNSDSTSVTKSGALVVS